ncbi:MAG: hypothetical protein EAX90_08120 [Candidatus Heimdallarchaeota archaeon]|nr:hypothetical protein [Candidatus Heimdallarchaeota archaeon]
MPKIVNKINDVFYSKFNQIRFETKFYNSKKLPFEEYLQFTQEILTSLLFLKFLCQLGIIRVNNKKIDFVKLIELLKKKYQFQSNLLILFTNLRTENEYLEIESDKIATPLIHFDFCENLLEKIQFFKPDNQIWFQFSNLIIEYEWEFETNNRQIEKLSPKIIAEIYEKDLVLRESTEEIKLEDMPKIFNQLNRRRKKGAYYTPIKITNFMVDSTIELHLEEELGKEIRLDKIVQTKEDSNQLLSLLDEIKILDPACGSGDFLLIAAKRLFHIKKEILVKLGKELSDFKIKQQILLQNIFGVDIDYFAIKNTENRLFFWLLESLEVEITETLPNLFLNLKVGNSLIGWTNEDITLTGVEINSSRITEMEYLLSSLNVPDKSTKHKTYTKAIKRIKNVIDLWKKNDLLLYFDGLKIIKKELTEILTTDELNSNNSRVIKDFYLLVNDELQLITNDTYILHLKDKKKLAGIQFEDFKSVKLFHWKLEFQEILDNGGFDVIISNPPYIEIKKFRNETEKKILRVFYYSAYKLFDIAILFIERAIILSKNYHFISYIITNKFASTDFGYKIREMMLTKTKIKRIYDVSYLPVFANTAAYSVIIILQKAAAVLDRDNLENEILIQPEISDLSELGKKNEKMVIIKQKEMYQMPNKIIDLSGNLPILKEVFQDKEVKKFGDHGEFYYRILGFTDWIGKLRHTSKKPESEKSLRFIGTTNIKPYAINFRKQLKLAGKSFKEAYLNYEEDFEDQWKIFQTRKICIREVALELTAAYDMGISANVTGIYIFIPNSLREIRSLICLLNSKVLNFFFKSMFGTSHMAGGYLRFNSSYLKELPIKIPYTKWVDYVFYRLDGLFNYLFFLKYLLLRELEEEVAKTVKEYNEYFERLVDLIVFDTYFPVKKEKRLINQLKVYDIDIEMWLKDTIEPRDSSFHFLNFTMLHNIQQTYEDFLRSKEIKEHIKEIESHKYYKLIFQD